MINRIAMLAMTGIYMSTIPDLKKRGVYRMGVLGRVDQGGSVDPTRK